MEMLFENVSWENVLSELKPVFFIYTTDCYNIYSCYCNAWNSGLHNLMIFRYTFTLQGSIELLSFIIAAPSSVN